MTAPNSTLLPAQTPVPLRHIDLYLLGVRLVTLGAATSVSLSNASLTRPLIPVTWVFVIVLAYTLVLVPVILIYRPVRCGRAGALLASDTLLALLAIYFTGNASSYFYTLLILPIIEAGVMYRWRVAMMLIVGVLMLRVGLTVLGPEATGGAASWTTLWGSLFGLCAFGFVTTFISVQARAADVEHRKTAQRAVQYATLNRISRRLREGELDMDRTLDILTRSIGDLPGVTYNMILTPDDGWRVAATQGAAPLQPGEQTARETWLPHNQTLRIVDSNLIRDTPLSSPHSQRHRTIIIQLVTPGEKTLGILVIERQHDEPVTEDDHSILNALAAEVALALRNARLYAREQAQVEQLREFEAQKNTFFSTIAHELKTPLTVLKTLTPSMDQFDHLAPDIRREITTTVEQNLTRLEGLVSDLLDSTQLEANAIVLHRHPVDLVKRAEKVAEA